MAETEKGVSEIKIKIDAEFYTDGDFRFDNLDSLIDIHSSLYAGASVQYRASQNYAEQTIHIEFSAAGNDNPCLWAMKDLLESLVCNFRTHYCFLVKEMYDFLITARDNMLRDMKDICWCDTIGGNYEGTHISITKH